MNLVSMDTWQQHSPGGPPSPGTLPIFILGVSLRSLVLVRPVFGYPPGLKMGGGRYSKTKKQKKKFFFWEKGEKGEKGEKKKKKRKKKKKKKKKIKKKLKGEKYTGKGVCEGGGG